MGYWRFPYRTFFRWLFFFLFSVMIFVAPLIWALFWKGYHKETIDALNTSASYQHCPGCADAQTWYMAEQWPWVGLRELTMVPQRCHARLVAPALPLPPVPGRCPRLVPACP